MIRIVIIDRVKIIRLGLEFLFADEDDFQIVSSEDIALGAGKQEAADFIIYGCTAQTRAATQFICETKKNQPSVHILVFASLAKRSDVLALIKAGASACLPLTTDPQALLTIIRKIHQKQLKVPVIHFAGETKVEKLATGIFESLSEREFEVYKLLSSGFKITEVADELRINASSARTYKSRILQKFGVRSLSEISRKLKL